MDNVNVHKTHPLMIGAAIAVILTCLVALGVMTGVVPSPMNRAEKQEVATAPDTSTSSSTTTLREASPSGTTTTRESRTVTHKTTEPRRLTARAPEPAPAPATGATSSPAPSNTVASAAPAPAACANCGTVTSVRAVTQQGEASMIGPAAGALLGGVLGRQIGSGTGRTGATAREPGRLPPPK